MTLITCIQQPSLREEFYGHIDKAVRAHGKRALLFICGDFNAKVGVRNEADGLACLGNWARGKRNENGEALVYFAEQMDYKLLNTCFQHKPKHITTWQGTVAKNWLPAGCKNETRPVYNQIDYIMCGHRHRRMVPSLSKEKC